MESKQIRDLLEKYYEGLTTLQEEKVLKDFFRQPAVLPEDLEADRLLFLSYDVQAGMEPSPGFEQRLLQKVIRPSGTFRRTAVRYRYALSAAASLILILGSLWLILKTGDRYQDTYQNPELAYAEVKKTLFMVSEIMNEGTEAMGNMRYLKPPRELENLNSLSRGIHAMGSLQSINIVYDKMSVISKIDEIKEKIKRE